MIYINKSFIMFIFVNRVIIYFSHFLFQEVVFLFLLNFVDDSFMVNYF